VTTSRAGRRAHRLPQVGKLARQVERRQSARVGGHGKNAEGCGARRRVHRPRHHEIPDDGPTTEESEEFRSIGLAKQLPRERLQGGEVGIARIEHQLEAQPGLGIRFQEIEAPFVETQDLILEKSPEELLSKHLRRWHGRYARRVQLAPGPSDPPPGRPCLGRGGRKVEMGPALTLWCQSMNRIAPCRAGRDQQLEA